MSNYYILTNLLSDDERRVITSIVRHIELGGNKVGIQQIASENYVSTAFIMKLCKRLGFAGYSELYYNLAQSSGEGHRSSDPDEFDLNFYTYGLSVYGNMPLIEPLETRESKKIEELALVIDTSYSTSGELVRAFLAETYTLLKGRENFFHRMNLHLIQADNAIRQDLLIRNEDELIHAMNHFELRGGGGTDFRPAFEYVNQLCAEKKFSNLRGLLYFTDGMGTYPARRPAYDTAFLFLGEKFDDANVPPWAMKVVLDEDEFSGPTARAASALADALAEEDDPYRELNNS